MRESQFNAFARTAFAFALLALAIPLAGCGGGAMSVPITRDAFIPNFASETDPQTSLPNKLYHWRQFPVRVYISPTNSTPAMLSGVLVGLDWWERATDKVGSFVQVSDPASADIAIAFRDEGANGFSGRTAYSYDSGSALVNARISFNLNYLGDPSTIGPAAAHEMGHALGIGGHSNDHADLMSFSPGIFLLTSPSLRDVNTIKCGYAGLFGRAALAPASSGPIKSATIRCPSSIHP